MSTVMDEQAMLISIIVDAVMNKCMMSKSTLEQPLCTSRLL